MEPASSLIIRGATPVDFDAIAEVWWESSRTADGAPLNHPSLYELRGRIDDEIAGGWSMTVADLHARIVGFLALKPQTAILDQLFILPTEQRLGVGRALLQAAMSALPTGFVLRTSAENRRARRFYEREGL